MLIENIFAEDYILLNIDFSLKIKEKVLSESDIIHLIGALNYSLINCTSTQNEIIFTIFNNIFYKDGSHSFRKVKFGKELILENCSLLLKKEYQEHFIGSRISIDRLKKQRN